MLETIEEKSLVLMDLQKKLSSEQRKRSKEEEKALALKEEIFQRENKLKVHKDMVSEGRTLVSN